MGTPEPPSGPSSPPPTPDEPPRPPQSGWQKFKRALLGGPKDIEDPELFQSLSSEADRITQRPCSRYRAACIVPNEGLRLLIESLLHRLGLGDVETWTALNFD